MSAEGRDIAGPAIAELQNRFSEQLGMLPNALSFAAREVAAASDAEKTWLDSVHILEGWQTTAGLSAATRDILLH